MDKKLKQRLIGAIVLIALVVIFVPMLFTKHDQNTNATTQIIPPAPEQPTIQQAPTPPEAQMKTPVAQSTASSPAQVQSQPVENVPVSAVQNDNQNQETTESVKPVEQVAPSSPVKVSIPVTNNKNTPVKKETTPSTKIEKPKSALNLNDHIITNPIKTLKIRKSNLTSANVIQTKKESEIHQKKRLEKAAAHAKAYVVQLGAFSQQKNAEHLIEKLRVKGFTAFGYKVKQTNGKISTRVYVGPAVKLSSAREMITKLQKEMKIKGIVVRFDATKLR